MTFQDDAFPTPFGKSYKEKIFITVKAYPNPSKKNIETVCVAGITEKKEWIRIYPVPFRFLEGDQQFKVFSWIEASISKSSDFRPESFYINPQTIKIISEVNTDNGWRERNLLLDSLRAKSLEELEELRRTQKTSLGLIRPKEVYGLVIEKEDNEIWTEDQIMILRNPKLFNNANSDGSFRAINELEKIPFKFKYHFKCDDSRCQGHKIKILSWEIMETYRKWRAKYNDEWEEKFRAKLEGDFLGSKIDLQFFVGTIKAHPHIWNIIGLYYPPKSTVVERSLWGN